MRNLLISSILISVLITGCTGNGIKTEQHAGNEPPSAMRCTSKSDCDRKWQRAKDWVTENSYWPIDKATDSIIKTKQPRGRSFSYTSYEVIRDIHDGHGQILLFTSCSSVQCTPSPDKAYEEFYRYLSTGEDIGT